MSLAFEDKITADWIEPCRCGQSSTHRFARRREVLNQIRFLLLIKRARLLLQCLSARPMHRARRPQRSCELHSLWVVGVKYSQIRARLVTIGRSVSFNARKSSHVGRRHFKKPLSESVACVKTDKSIVIDLFELWLSARKTVLWVKTLLPGCGKRHRKCVFLRGTLFLLFCLQIAKSKRQVLQAGL
jgi:hypothetical protein